MQIVKSRVPQKARQASCVRLPSAWPRRQHRTQEAHRSYGGAPRGSARTCGPGLRQELDGDSWLERGWHHRRGPSAAKHAFGRAGRAPSGARPRFSLTIQLAKHVLVSFPTRSGLAMAPGRSGHLHGPRGDPRQANGPNRRASASTWTKRRAST